MFKPLSLLTNEPDSGWKRSGNGRRQSWSLFWYTQAALSVSLRHYSYQLNLLYQDKACKGGHWAACYHQAALMYVEASSQKN